MAADKGNSPPFTFQTLVRLVIFALFVYLLIDYLSFASRGRQSLTDPTILGEEIQLPSNLIEDQFKSLYQSLPPDSRRQLENLNQLPAVSYLQHQLEYFQGQLNGFPQKQIRQFKKQLLENIYQNLTQDL